MKMESKLKGAYGQGLCKFVLEKFYLMQGIGDHHG